MKSSKVSYALDTEARRMYGFDSFPMNTPVFYQCIEGLKQTGSDLDKVETYLLNNGLKVANFNQFRLKDESTKLGVPFPHLDEIIRPDTVVKHVTGNFKGSALSVDLFMVLADVPEQFFSGMYKSSKNNNKEIANNASYFCMAGLLYISGGCKGEDKGRYYWNDWRVLENKKSNLEDKLK